MVSEEICSLSTCRGMTAEHEATVLPGACAPLDFSSGDTQVGRAKPGSLAPGPTFIAPKANSQAVFHDWR